MTLRVTTALALALATGCVVGEDTRLDEDDLVATSHRDPAVDRGRDIWFLNSYGGEKFFAFLANHPDPQKRIEVGFDAVVNTPRDVRFDVWGVINDPDCSANPNGGADVCDDPNASGVIGIRKFDQADGSSLYGAACAACHAGFDPNSPPADPNAPTWDNIHPTIGNQYIKLGAVFAANLAPTDPRALMFAAWPDGTVDTTLLFSDNIMNPGVITAFWEHPHRPTFDVGLDEEKIRNGQGGEDDVGDLAALRVYTNIGVCFNECVVQAVVTETPIDIPTCRAQCPDFPPQQDLDDMTAFLRSIRHPRYTNLREVDPRTYVRGFQVFDQNCADCHDNSFVRRRVLSNDEVIPLDEDPDNTTNACRSLTTNWEDGKIWAQFSSQLYKDRIAAGDRGYRVMPLSGIWSTAPFLHNQSIGDWAPADATMEERGAVYEESMRELLATERDPVVFTTPIDLPTSSGVIPAGTPLAYIFSRNPATGDVLCTDTIENRGHHYGSDLPDADKEALIHWLKFQ